MTPAIEALFRNLAAGLAVIAGFWLAALAARAALGRFGSYAGAERIDLINIAATTAYWTLLGFGLVSGLGTMGVDVGALIAGLGLTGFALGFALRDAVSNLLAGLLILAYRPFHRGDEIAVDKYQGRVVAIDLRYTTLAADGKHYLVPNQTLFTNAITLFDAGKEHPEAPPGPPQASPQGSI